MDLACSAIDAGRSDGHVRAPCQRLATGNQQLHAKRGGDLSHFKPRPQEKQIPPRGGLQQQWINACKTDLKTSCDMDYSGTAIEQMLLGLVAYRVGKKIDYDGQSGQVANSDEANALLRKDDRAGWPLDG